MSLDRSRTGIAVPEVSPSPRLRGAGFSRPGWVAGIAALVASGHVPRAKCPQSWAPTALAVAWAIKEGWWFFAALCVFVGYLMATIATTGYWPPKRGSASA